MKHTSFRGGWTERKCSRCQTRDHDITVDGIELCEECLTKAVHATSGDPSAANAYEIRQLEGELGRLTGRAYRGLKKLPKEAVDDLRRAVRDVEQTKSSVNSKLRRHGLPGV